MSKEYFYDGRWRGQKPNTPSELAGFLFGGSKEREIGEPIGDIKAFMRDIDKRYSEGEIKPPDNPLEDQDEEQNDLWNDIYLKIINWDGMGEALKRELKSKYLITRK